MAGHFYTTIENSITGKPVAGATVTVYQSGATVSGTVAAGTLAVSGTLATIFSDDGITGVATSIVTSDSTGFVEFWTNETSVVILISYDGTGKKAITDVEITGGSVSSDITALGTRMTAAELVTLDATVVAFKGLTGAADKVPYFTGTDTMALADFTAAGRALVDDANAAAQRTTLGAAASGATTASGLTMTTARLLGRTTASTGAIEEITVGSGLSLAAGSLTATSSVVGGSSGMFGSGAFVKGTTAGTPGTGAFTPNTAVTGFSAWSVVVAGWIGLVRYDDGAAWELAFSYWNGTTLSRASTQVYASSSGSQLTLTSATTATLITDIQGFLDGLSSKPWRMVLATVSNSSPASLGIPAPSSYGTAAASTIVNTNYLTEQPRMQYTSGTAADNVAGWNGSSNVSALYTTTAGRGGFVYDSIWGASQLPANPRFGAYLSNGSLSGGQPSAQNASFVALAKDSGDTNIQFMTNDGTAPATKGDTGIAIVANGWYRASFWVPPGGGTASGLMIQLDTGAIWYGSTTATLPADGAALIANLHCGLNGTDTGTACIFHPAHMAVKAGY
jgi:hypothetical protein